MTFHPILPADQFAEGTIVAAEVEGRAIIVCHSGAGFYAMDNLCTHNGARLSPGRIKKNTIACPLHGARFDLETGVCLSKALGCAPIVTHQVRVNAGQVEVALSEQPVEPPMV